jgi:hypothetical protein
MLVALAVVVHLVQVYKAALLERLVKATLAGTPQEVLVRVAVAAVVVLAQLVATVLVLTLVLVAQVRTSLRFWVRSVAQHLSAVAVAVVVTEVRLVPLEQVVAVAVVGLGLSLLATEQRTQAAVVVLAVLEVLAVLAAQVSSM